MKNVLTFCDDGSFEEPAKWPQGFVIFVPFCSKNPCLPRFIRLPAEARRRRAVKKTVFAKTNPIFVASLYQSNRNKEKTSNLKISKTHGQSKQVHGGDSPFKISQAHSSLSKPIQGFFGEKNYFL
jgi:hypothetical protein